MLLIFFIRHNFSSRMLLFSRSELFTVFFIICVTSFSVPDLIPPQFSNDIECLQFLLLSSWVVKFDQTEEMLVLLLCEIGGEIEEKFAL